MSKRVRSITLDVSNPHLVRIYDVRFEGTSTRVNIIPVPRVYDNAVYLVRVILGSSYTIYLINPLRP